MSICGFVVGFSRGWKLSFVILSTIPATFIAGFLFSFFLGKVKKDTANAYSSAGGCAEQALNGIKTVKSLCGEDFEIKSYSVSLLKAWKITVHSGLKIGFCFGFIFFTMFSSNALAFWYGSILIGNAEYNPTFDRIYTSGDVFIILFAIIISSFSIGNLSPCIKNFSLGKVAGFKIF